MNEQTHDRCTLARGVKGYYDVYMNRITNALTLFSLLLCLLICAIPRPVHAENNFGTTVLACFHPDATFTSATYARGRGHHTWSGWIKFREGRAEGAMSFVMDMKTRNGDTFFRVVPVMDGGMTQAASSCYLREWQRY